jgi:hypothetical protein
MALADRQRQRAAQAGQADHDPRHVVVDHPITTAGPVSTSATVRTAGLVGTGSRPAGKPARCGV